MLSRTPLLLLVLCVGALAASQVWMSHLRVGVAQQASKLKKEKNILGQDVQGLSLELASLNRPDTLRRLAREKLGMHAPSSMQVVKP